MVRSNISEERAPEGVAQLNRLLSMILEAAVEVLGFDGASITASSRGETSSVAITDQELLALDQAQYDAGAGPCLDAMERGATIVVEDVSETGEDAWQQFSETASMLGVRSSLSMPLDLADAADLAASLNLYSRQQRGRSEQVIQRAGVFASQLALAMQSVQAYSTTARLAANLAEAMQSRAAIEQAKGIVIAERGVTPEEAFQLLKQTSQDENRKLRDVARALVEERRRG